MTKAHITNRPELTHFIMFKKRSQWKLPRYTESTVLIAILKKKKKRSQTIERLLQRIEWNRLTVLCLEHNHYRSSWRWSSLPRFHHSHTYTKHNNENTCSTQHAVRYVFATSLIDSEIRIRKRKRLLCSSSCTLYINIHIQNIDHQIQKTKTKTTQWWYSTQLAPIPLASSIWTHKKYDVHTERESVWWRIHMVLCIYRDIHGSASSSNVHIFCTQSLPPLTQWSTILCVSDTI